MSFKRHSTSPRGECFAHLHQGGLPGFALLHSVTSVSGAVGSHSRTVCPLTVDANEKGSSP